MQTEVTPLQSRRATQVVAPDVIGLKIGFVNVFLIGRPEIGAAWVLVDTGVGHCSAQIIRAAEERFGAGTRPEAIILTHGHFDHIGAVRELAERWDVPVYAHRRELLYLTGKLAYPPADPLAGEGLMAWLSPLYPRQPIDLGERVQPLPSDGRLPCLPEWQIIHTPGHTVGHVSLFRPMDRLLISGDALITTRQESIRTLFAQTAELRRPPAYFTTDWPAVQRSIERLAALDPQTVASGHGPMMHGWELQSQLQTLVQRFNEIGMPRRGRYVTRASTSGVTSGARRWMRLLQGASAGLLATLPMTLAILAFSRQPARDRRDPFPPRQVTASVTSRLGLWQQTNSAQHVALTLASHFGYGALLGALYNAVAPARLARGPVGGAAYGLLVWAISYAGWLPALHLMRPPQAEPGSRNLQMILAHLVWGLSMNLLARR